jgi:hypothetical protein
MKQLIILGYVCLMLSVTVISVKAATILTMDKVALKYRTIDRGLSDFEVEAAGLTRVPDAEYIQSYDLRETRIKNGFGWDTKIDTIKSNYTTITRKQQ